MSKEFDRIKAQAEAQVARDKVTRKERYDYARSLGFSGAMAVRLLGKTKEKILELSKELKP